MADGASYLMQDKTMRDAVCKTDITEEKKETAGDKGSLHPKKHRMRRKKRDDGRQETD